VILDFIQKPAQGHSECYGDVSTATVMSACLRVPDFAAQQLRKLLRREQDRNNP
jgi:hypothetical protein